MSQPQPNFLVILTDQLAAPALPFHGNPAVKAPHLSALAAEGVTFDNAYCNSPLCAPSRASLMSGQLPSRIGVYDNAAEFRADVPTYAHYLRALGYQTSLSGKMHFVGPDQLHGFEERLTTDIYPADFGWTPDWDSPDERLSWHHNMLSVLQAGPCLTTNQLDFDEEVQFRGLRKLYDLARGADRRPFLLQVSFTHPHDPYAISHSYWERYRPEDINMPRVPDLSPAARDPHSQRIRAMCGLDDAGIMREHILNARRAYYSAISYIDDKVGQLLQTLSDTGLADDTIVIFTSDHGDMLGERGLWYKMTFFEWSARVPLIVHAPQRFRPQRVAQPVSLVDLLPTLLDLARAPDQAPLAEPVDGHSLLPLMSPAGNKNPQPVACEYLAEGVSAPALMLRRGPHKFVYGLGDPDQLYDLSTDPDELRNLAGRPEHEALRQALCAEVLQRWNPPDLRARVVASQRRRRLVGAALAAGRLHAWDFQPVFDASQQYVRSHLDLNDLERQARFPPPEPPLTPEM
jgi:choline-sulfatase